MNHESAPLSVRERLAFDAASLPKALNSLQFETSCEGAVILSTCNRSEIYCVVEEVTSIINWLSNEFSLDGEELRRYLYLFEGYEVFKHAVRVASGMNSMVLGEPQIFGQTKAAVRASQETGFLCDHLDKLFQMVFTTTKMIRSQTDLGRYSLSLPAIALKICQSVFTNLKDQTLLFIGAGEMIKLCANHFSSEDFCSLTFANRTFENARQLIDEHGGKFLPLALVPESLAEFDVIVSCTGSQLPIIGKGSVERSIRIRRHKPCLIFDLAVPRDIEISIGELDDVFLYSIDDLGEVIREGLQNRKHAIEEAEKFVIEGAKKYQTWQQSGKAVSTIKALRGFADSVVESELNEALKSIERGDSLEDVLRNMSRSIKNKLLDRPSRNLNQAPVDQQRLLAESLDKLFNLDSTQ